MNDEVAESLFARLPDEGAREELVDLYGPLVRHLAHRYAHRGQEPEDLVQVAYVGLLNAIDRFDPNYGSRFISFAVPTITGELKRHFRDSGWGAGVSRRMKDISVRSRRASDHLSQRLGRSPTIEEISDYLDIPADDVAEAATLGTAYRPDALDASLRDDEPSRITTLGEEDGRLDLLEDLDAIEPILERQPDREKEILRLRFYEDLTQREIAERVGISQMHVSRILNSCLQKMRVLAS